MDYEELFELLDAKTTLHCNYAGTFVYSLESSILEENFHLRSLNRVYIDLHPELTQGIKDARLILDATKINITFVDMWYNGVDSNIDDSSWEELSTG